MQAQTFHGARAKIRIGGNLVGIFNSCSYGLAYDIQPIYTLGRFSPAELVPTGQEAISCSCTGFRIVDKGPHVVAGLPFLQDLLNSEDTVITLEDRQTGKNIAVIEGIRAQSYQTAVNARGVQEITVSFIGLRISDESGINAESEGASNLTDS
jgi:hypothetical protein